jgi:hypothetical protein
MVGGRATCWDGVVMNESIAQLDELKDGAFLGLGWEEYQAVLIQGSKLLFGVPVVACALAALIALAVVLCPLVPFVELWRRWLRARTH